MLRKTGPTRSGENPATAAATTTRYSGPRIAKTINTTAAAPHTAIVQRKLEMNEPGKSFTT